MTKLTKAEQRAFINSIDLSTRRKRRAATVLAEHFIELIYEQEEAYQGRIPPNLQGCDAYTAAEETMETLQVCIDCLLSAYD